MVRFFSVFAVLAIFMFAACDNSTTTTTDENQNPNDENTQKDDPGTENGQPDTTDATTLTDNDSATTGCTDGDKKCENSWVMTCSGGVFTQTEECNDCGPLCHCEGSGNTASCVHTDPGNDNDQMQPDTDTAVVTGCLTGGKEYTVTKQEKALYESGCVYAITVGSDPVDLYIPNAPKTDTLYTAIYMQGAMVDKGFYSTYAKQLTTYGFIVAIPNHKSFSGNNMTENKAFNAVWDFVKNATKDNASPLFERTSTAKVAVMGHSNGGMASVGIIGNTCGQPTCSGSYQAPAELSAGVLYGTNTVMPVIGTVSAFNTRNIPTIFLQGRIDGKAKYDDTVKTFDKTTGSPVLLVGMNGMNHYGTCDVNNPQGAQADSNKPTTDQAVGIETTSRWAGLFLRAHLFGDNDAKTWIYDGSGDAVAKVDQKK